MDLSSEIQGVFLLTFGTGLILLLYWLVRCMREIWKTNRVQRDLIAEWDKIVAQTRARTPVTEKPDQLAEYTKDFLEEATRDL